MLGAHSHMVCLPEAHFLSELLPKGDPDDLLDPSSIFDRIEQHWRFRIWEWPLARPRPLPAPATYRTIMEWLFRRYDEDFASGHSHYWIEHRPGHLHALPRLLAHFPDARVIHLVRDGRAVAASIMSLDWGPSNIIAAAHSWTAAVGLGFAAASLVPHERFAMVEYETLLRLPEAEMRRIATWLGLPFEPVMISGTGLRLPSYTRRQHGLIGAGLDPSRIDAWRARLPARHVEIFESIAGDLLAFLGYERIYETARRCTPMERLAISASGRIKRRLNRWRYERRRALALSKALYCVRAKDRL
jgi:Sulfotransferase family